MNKLDVETFGQVFTQDHTVDFMLTLRENSGSVLEPSCGDGAFSDRFPDCVAIEIDKKVAPYYAINKDFFEYDKTIKFDTIIGNPPFVRYKDIYESTKKLLADNKYDEIFDERSNLFLFFILKCVLHLDDGGELIFINPREFLKATSSIKLNEFLWASGTITDFVDLGDARLFGNFTPNCVIWRFVKGDFSKKTRYSHAIVKDNKIALTLKEERNFKNVNGQLLFTASDYIVPAKDILSVKVGGVSGADEIFAHENGNRAFVTSKTFTTGKTRKFFYNIKAQELEKFKSKLISRKIKSFTNDNWYMWGRNNYESNEKRVYVNCKTRKQNPFFKHSCNNYDGSILGLFPKNQNIDLSEFIKDLNAVDWEELGFVCNGRSIFSQKSLENCLLPKCFEKYIGKASLPQLNHE